MRTIPVFAAACGGARAAAGSTNSTAANRVLIIDPSSMPVAAGKATLTIGPLLRTGGVYSGDYKISVFPYFYNNESGRLAIVVSDESLAGMAQGKAVAIIGSATTGGKGGRTRHIDATATPADLNQGTLKLWFMAGDRKMIFEPAYHFAGNGTAAVAVKTIETNPASGAPRRLPVSHRQALDAAFLFP
jgi:hypothetical protein